MSNKLKRGATLFIDRDGVLNEIVVRDGEIHSPRNESELKTYPEMSSLKRVKDLGYTLVMVTNQPDIERGIVPMDFLQKVHDNFKEAYSLDAVYCCPHASNDHPDKKPNPGMFLRAAKDLSLNLSISFHLGDTERDTAAAKNAGIKSILWTRPYNMGIPCDFRIASIDELITILS